MIYWFAFAAVITLDTLCVRYIFPLFPHVNSHVNFLQAFSITLVSAVLIGIVLLEYVGGKFGIWALKNFGLPGKIAFALIKNVYLTSAPFLNAAALIIWSTFIPALGFSKFWPAAFLAGLLLDFIDRGIIVPWFFHLNEALNNRQNL